jgi:hypothetical protein
MYRCQLSRRSQRGCGAWEFINQRTDVLGGVDVAEGLQKICQLCGFFLAE